MAELNKDVSFEEFNMIQKNRKFNFLQQDVYNQIFNKYKYIIIRKIPIVFLIFLLITLLLIYNVPNICHNKSRKIQYNKICYLFIGLTITIGNVYLLSLRTEYKEKMYNMFKYKKEIDDYNSYKLNNALYNSQSFNLNDYK